MYALKLVEHRLRLTADPEHPKPELRIAARPQLARWQADALRLARIGEAVTADELPELTTHPDGGFTLTWPRRLVIRYRGRQLVTAEAPGEGVEWRRLLARSNDTLIDQLGGAAK